MHDNQALPPLINKNYYLKNNDQDIRKATYRVLLILYFKFGGDMGMGAQGYAVKWGLFYIIEAGGVRESRLSFERRV